MPLYLGLISGTSMDGIDAALLEIDDDRMQVRAALSRAWSGPVRDRLRSAAEHYQDVGLGELGQLDTIAGTEFALAAEQLLAQSQTPASAVRAIGSHGQTILHQPRGEAPFTLQIGDPNIIAEHLQIDVVGDFRRRDLAAGGEGAPLMPGFHAAAFGARGETRAVVNIGGIANVTLLAADGGVLGFDTGPGNCLLDGWARRHLHQPYDADGAWGARGQVDIPLLNRLRQLPYFARPAPKSTGRETFSDSWVATALSVMTVSPVDVQATLCELTARTIVDSLVPAPTHLFVCGGGAFNADLMARLARALPATRVTTTAECGIAPERVEAAGFAWLAHRYINGLAGNLPSVTGARRPVPLGALFRGGLL